MTMDPLDSLAFWKEADDYAIEQATSALAVLGLIYSFSREEMAMAAAVLGDPNPETAIDRRELERSIMEETGIKFSPLPARQWSVIAIELEKEQGK